MHFYLRCFLDGRHIILCMGSLAQTHWFSCHLSREIDECQKSGSIDLIAGHVPRPWNQSMAKRHLRSYTQSLSVWFQHWHPLLFLTQEGAQCPQGMDANVAHIQLFDGLPRMRTQIKKSAIVVWENGWQVEHLDLPYSKGFGKTQIQWGDMDTYNSTLLF